LRAEADPSSVAEALGFVLVLDALGPPDTVDLDKLPLGRALVPLALADPAEPVGVAAGNPANNSALLNVVQSLLAGVLAVYGS
jgi:hypothetical protein